MVHRRIQLYLTVCVYFDVYNKKINSYFFGTPCIREKVNDIQNFVYFIIYVLSSRVHYELNNPDRTWLYLHFCNVVLDLKVSLLSFPSCHLLINSCSHQTTYRIQAPIVFILCYRLPLFHKVMITEQFSIFKQQGKQIKSLLLLCPQRMKY